MEGNPLIRKFSYILDLSGQDKKTLLELQQDCVEFAPRKHIVTVGEDFAYTYIVLDGWAYTYKSLRDGRQQVLNYSLCGDFIGLYATVLRSPQFSIKALTSVSACRIKPDNIIELFRTSPHLAAAICCVAARDEVLLAEQITRIGRRTAFERTGHILLELHRRLEAVGKVAENSFEFPVTQELLSDTLGLTAVHMNRTIRALKEEGMISFNGKQLTIEKPDELAIMVGFDPSYLEKTNLPEEITSHISV